VIRWGDDDSDAISLFVLACRKLPRGTVSLIPVEKNIKTSSRVRFENKKSSALKNALAHYNAVVESKVVDSFLGGFRDRDPARLSSIPRC
jgi:hypothetical protein